MLDSFIQLCRGSAANDPRALRQEISSLPYAGINRIRFHGVRSQIAHAWWTITRSERM